MEGPNRKGRKSSGEGGKAQTERKEIKCGRRERELKTKGKEKRRNGKGEGRVEKERDDSTEKIAKLRRKGREK